jgi:urea carboxylase
MWNRWRATADFEKPWLLRFFDQIRFYPVTADELLQLREDFPQGRYKVRIEETTFRLHEYHKFLRSIDTEAAAFKAKREAAFAAERERWHQAGLDTVPPEPEPEVVEEQLSIPPGVNVARAPLPANVWQVLVQPGTRVAAGEKLVVLEAMKMEIPVTAAEAGIVSEILCAPGKQVSPGQALCLVEPAA